jgi:hypothetical protein
MFYRLWQDKENGLTEKRPNTQADKQFEPAPDEV